MIRTSMKWIEVCLFLSVFSAIVVAQENRPSTSPSQEKPAEPAKGSEDAVRVALGGHCPVSYQTQSAAVKGDPAHAVPFRGWVYYCASDEAKKTFEADPARYAAQYGELCTTALGGMYGNRLPSDPTVFYVIDGKLYLFSSLRARNAFDREPKEFIAKADNLYAKPSMFGNDITSYQLKNQAEKGDPKHIRIYRGLVYHFADEAGADAFDKDPHRFIPRYDGYCTQGVSIGKKFPADPKNFSVFDGKTYLFFDPKVKQDFDANPKAMIERADANWVAFPEEKPRKSPPRPQP